jgi:hypothetical protein
MSGASATARASAPRSLAGAGRAAAPLWAGDKERRITAWVPPDLDRRFTAIAKARGVSKGGLARELIRSFVSRETVAPASTCVPDAAQHKRSAGAPNGAEHDGDPAAMHFRCGAPASFLQPSNRGPASAVEHCVPRRVRDTE